MTVAEKALMAKPYFDNFKENFTKRVFAVLLSGSDDEIIEIAKLYRFLNTISKSIDNDITLNNKKED